LVRVEDKIAASAGGPISLRDFQQPEATPYLKVGDSFSKDVTFDAAGISAFALATGDTNPLHHDAEYAAKTRFGGIIVSGSHLTALMSGLVSGNFSGKGTNVGLDFSYRFQAPIRVGDKVTMRWTVTNRMPQLSLKGDIVTLEGEVVRADGMVAVTATAHLVLFHGNA
jgi:acyl dehydratase